MKDHDCTFFTPIQQSTLSGGCVCAAGSLVHGDRPLGESHQAVVQVRNCATAASKASQLHYLADVARQGEREGSTNDAAYRASEFCDLSQLADWLAWLANTLAQERPPAAANEAPPMGRR